jgi:hypothetical protein
MHVYIYVYIYIYIYICIYKGEILGMAEPLLSRNFHPTVIVKGYCQALQKALEVCSFFSVFFNSPHIFMLLSQVLPLVILLFGSSHSSVARGRNLIVF